MLKYSGASDYSGAGDCLKETCLFANPDFGEMLKKAAKGNQTI